MTTEITVQQDERGGLPSASRMRRVRRCPGSVEAERHAPPESNLKDADEGTARHNLIELGADADSIDDSNASYTVERAQQLEREAIRRIGMEGEQPIDDFRERRLWVHDDEMNVVTSAKLDRGIVWQNTALILDHKTLFGDHGHAKENEQLLTQVIALWESSVIGRVFAALIQPNLAKDRQLTIVEYTFDEIAALRQMLLGWLAAAAKPGAPRIVGPWCDHCRARSQCPEAIAVQHGLTVKANVELATPEQLAYLLDRCDIAEAVIDGIRSEAKRRLNAGEAVPGFGLKPGAMKRTVTSPSAAFGILSKMGATEAEFIGTVSVKLGELEKLHASKFDGKKADAKKSLEAALTAAGALETKQNAASLVRL